MNTINIKKVNIASVEPASDVQWDQAWRLCEYSTFFHSRKWAAIWNYVSRGSLKPHGLALVFSDGKQALLPLSVESGCGGLVKTYHASAMGTFGGLLSVSDLSAEHVRLVGDYLCSGFGNLIWRGNPYQPHQDVLDYSGRKSETYALDLRNGFDSIYQSWSKGGWKKGASSASRTAYKVRKARKDGVTVRMAKSLDDWRKYFEVYQDTLQRWGDNATSRYGWVVFEQLYKQAQGDIQLWLGEYKGKVIVGEVCLYSSRHAVTWHAAALKKYYKLHARNVLVFEMVKDACARGCNWFDFNPSGGHEGVCDFKLSFGCEILRSDVVSRVTPSVRAINLLKRCRSHLLLK